MSNLICDYCGTEYASHMQRCPLCGSLNESLNYGAAMEEEEELVSTPPRRPQAPAQPQRRQPPVQTPKGRTPPSYTPLDDDEDDEEEEIGRRHNRRGSRQAPKEDAIPRWISVLVCVVLGLAVVIGALFALYSLGILSPKEKNKEDTSLTLPIDPNQTDTPETDKPETDGTVPPVTVPEDTTPEPVTPEPEPEPVSVACIGIKLDRMDASLLSKGESFVLSATITPENTTDKLVWSSEKPNISKVDQNGRVTAVNGGTTNIIATCGDMTAKCIVRNKFPYDASLDTSSDAESGTGQTGGSASLSLTDFTLFKVGETAKITVKNVPDGSAVNWTSSDTSVATVDGGTVKAVKSGTATVTAEIGGQKLKCIVRCNLKGVVDANDQNAEHADGDSAGSAKLSHEDVTLGKGESFKLSVTGGSGSGWSISDGSICSVDANGNVKGLATGTATVSTTVGGQKLKCIVRVK